MPKLTAGDVMKDYVFDTPYAKNVSLSSAAAKGAKTAVVFLRYYGCPLCQFDIHEFAIHYDVIAATGGKLLVVLQSDPAKLADKLGEEKLPFDIICDPDRKIYLDLDIQPAAKKEDMIGPDSMAKLGKVREAGYEHGDYEGVEEQLPAVFVVDDGLTVTYCDYCKTITDVPDAAGIAALLS